MYSDMCTYHNVPLCFFGSKDELGHFTGKEIRASVAILDEGFKNAITKQIKLLDSE